MHQYTIHTTCIQKNRIKLRKYILTIGNIILFVILCGIFFDISLLSPFNSLFNNKILTHLDPSICISSFHSKTTHSKRKKIMCLHLENTSEIACQKKKILGKNNFLYKKSFIPQDYRDTFRRNKSRMQISMGEYYM